MDMKVTGNIVSIVFYNSDNGYTVLQLECEDGDTITCVGNLPSLSVGEVLTVEGHSRYHSKYGEQLVIDNYIVDNPTTEAGIIKYLSSGLIKGVGPVTAKNIYNMFGGDAMSIIENCPQQLVKVKGISKTKAQDIANSVNELKKVQTQIMYLSQYDITTNLAMKIFNVYKDNTKAIVSANPYKLIDDVDGVGFSTADRIAKSMGHDQVGEFRVRAGVVYVLKSSADKQGNTYLVLDDCIDRVSQLIGVDFVQHKSVIDSVLTKLVLEPTIKLVEIDGVMTISLVRMYSVEHAIATNLLRLNRDAKRILIDCDSKIQHFEQTNNIKFHQSQLQAVKSAVVNGVTVITGGPGTGKTTIVKCIADILSSQGLRIEYCAPTGRASKRLSIATGREAKTIHRLLGFEFVDGKARFVYNYNNTLRADVVIVDEMSMVDVNIMASLLKALESGTRIVLVGDKDQLPSVGAGNVLSDIIASKVFDVRYLTYIYRQSEDSLIIANAHLVNSGKLPTIDNSSKDFFVMNMDNMEDIADTVVSLVTSRLPKYLSISPADIQVLVALKSGVSGIDNLNKKLQYAINAPSIAKSETNIGKHILRVGDRVMQTVNNYELPFVRKLANGTVEEGQGVFNGDIGYISMVDRVNGLVEVYLDDDRIARYSAMDLDELTLAYAVTIHKSQGSEFDVVVIPLVNGPPTIINRNLLYTAITRAKRAVVLVGSKKVLSMMVYNNYIATRTTLLRKFLLDEQLRYNTFFGSSDE